MSDIAQQIKDIKHSFRLMMNGVASASMREKGSSYHVNWGASLSMLKDKAKELGSNYELSVALWKENVRECKILAVMIMPKDMMTHDLANLWMEQTNTQEIAELASFYVYQHVADAHVMAMEWLASDKELYQLCGYNTLSGLFKKGFALDFRDTNEYMDQLMVALSGNSFAVKKSAMLSIQHFCTLGPDYETLAKTALKQLNVELF